LKVVLISFEQYIAARGLRIISSLLGERGIDVSVIFVRLKVGRNLDPEVIKRISMLSKDADLIGISLLSNYFVQASKLTEYLRTSSHAMILWGGVHPTFRPEECLRAGADAVCIGEGEKAVLELIQKIEAGKPFLDTMGVWFREGEKIIKNNLAPLVENLDKLPHPDFGPRHHYIRVGDDIIPLTNELFEQYLEKRIVKGEVLTEFYISTSRGCPYNCSYCASPTMRRMYMGQRYLRFYTPQKVVDEVTTLIDRFPFIKMIYFCDDDFFACPKKRISDFARLWKSQVGLPFLCTFTPPSYDEEKLRMLVDAGLAVVNMGIQSISETATKLYNREYSKEQIMQIATSLSIHARTKEIMPPVYDFIVDNPYESPADKLENLDFALKLPKPKRIKIFSLVPFCGTPIYHRFQADGLIKDDVNDIYGCDYSTPEKNLINALFKLASVNSPESLTRLFSRRFFVETCCESTALIRLLSGFSRMWQIVQTLSTLKTAYHLYTATRSVYID